MRLLAIAIAAVMIFARLGALPLRDPDEGRNSEIAREMLASGSWVTPTYDGCVYLDKPSFFVKTVSLSFALFGENETAGRLPSALFACGILLMAYRFCRREYDEDTAALAVIVIATTPLFFALARHVIIDMTLAFFVCGAIFAGYIAETHEGARRKKWYLLGAVAAGFATLVKGPVGFIVPMLTLAVFNVAQRNRGWWKRLFHPLHFLVVLAVVGPWFYAVVKQHPDFARYGLLEESFHRFTTKSFSRTAPFYYYGLVVLGGVFAWSILMPGAAIAAWRSRQRLARPDKLFICWAIVVVIFFSLSKSKLPHYILSALVATGILVARLFALALKNRDGKAARVVFGGLIATAAVALLVGGFLSAILLWPDLPTKLFKAKKVEFDRVALAFGPAIAVLAIVGVLAIAGRVLRSIPTAFCAFLAMPLCFVTFAFSGIERYSEASSSRMLAKRIGEMGENVEVAGLSSFAPGLPFYTKQKVALITTGGTELSNYIAYELARSTNWPAHMVRFEERETWLSGRTNAVCLIAKGGAVRELERIAGTRKLEAVELVPGWSAVLIPAGIKN